MADKQAKGELNVRLDLMNRILQVNAQTFEEVALDVFRYQYTNNGIYRQFCDLIGRTPDSVSEIDEIPHLPIQFFKSGEVTSGSYEPETVFQSSTTTGQVPSRHSVRSVEWYKRVSDLGYESIYGESASSTKWFGLLPSYLERPNASLVFMVRHFMQQGGGDFYIDQFDRLYDALSKAVKSGVRATLIGVSFALLAFVEKYSINDSKLTIIETGGMKGRGKEFTRTELHGRLMQAFPASPILSEYGMTELLSQAWTKGGSRFCPAPTLRIHVRELSDPLSDAGVNSRGALNIIDLANIDSCSFIATDDAGVVYEDHSFEVIGRLDGSEQRGCNLMFGNQ